MTLANLIVHTITFIGGLMLVGCIGYISFLVWYLVSTGTAFNNASAVFFTIFFAAIAVYGWVKILYYLFCVAKTYGYIKNNFQKRESIPLSISVLRGIAVNFQPFIIDNISCIQSNTIDPGIDNIYRILWTGNNTGGKAIPGL